jgi:N-acetylmuramoyl-L-alanine amidase
MFGTLGSGGAAAMAPAPVREEQVLRLPPSKPDIVEKTTYQEAAAARHPPAPPAAKPRKGQKYVIVIDAGHGGQDPGAIGANGTKEKTVTLAAAQELKKQLEAMGNYKVYMTREKDKFIKLQDRMMMGRKFGADLFISLHADSIDKPGVSGASIYTLSNTASDAQTEKLAARENRADLIAGVDLRHEDKDVANILIDLAMRDTMNQSKFFANTVVKKAKGRGIRLLERPHRFAGFAVLKAPDVPSVLLEMGFMSNAKEVDQLSSPVYRKQLMSAVAEGIDAYFSRVEKSGQK